MKWNNNKTDNPVDEDGWTVIPPEPTPSKGLKCGACGMKFEHGKAYGYSCNISKCPIYLQITCFR